MCADERGGSVKREFHTRQGIETVEVPDNAVLYAFMIPNAKVVEGCLWLARQKYKDRGFPDTKNYWNFPQKDRPYSKIRYLNKKLKNGIIVKFYIPT